MDIIIETPKGSREKYKYDHEHRMFRLLKVLPSGLVFPFDFGFIPNTKGDDGDPLDVMVISEFKGFPGCIIDCRIIGCIQVEQTENGAMIKNDRFLAVPEVSALYENVLNLSDLPSTIISELESFFYNYISQEGKSLKLTGNLSSSQAMSVINLQESMLTGM
jgi:inorganic pyrophosphatase